MNLDSFKRWDPKNSHVQRQSTAEYWSELLRTSAWSLWKTKPGFSGLVKSVHTDRDISSRDASQFQVVPGDLMALQLPAHFHTTGISSPGGTGCFWWWTLGPCIPQRSLSSLSSTPKYSGVPQPAMLTLLQTHTSSQGDGATCQSSQRTREGMERSPGRKSLSRRVLWLYLLNSSSKSAVWKNC